MLIYVLVVFILTYVLIIALPNYKTYIALGASLLAVIPMLISGLETWGQVFESIDLNVLMMLVGVMLTVGVFADSNMPNKIAENLMGKIHSSIFALVMLAVLSGFISAFVDNVATVLMLAPIGIAVAKKMEVSPVPVLICIAVSSNLQGAATLVGDTTSIMLGNFANMGFFDFFILNGKPSIFFAVELGAIATIPVLIFIFRKDRKKINYIPEKIVVNSIIPTIILCLNLSLLIGFSFMKNKISLTNGIICMSCGVVSFAYYVIRFKKNVFKQAKDSIDFQTVFFLLFLFILIGAVSNVGIIQKISEFFIGIGNQNIFLLYTVIVFGSVILSMFIDNIPYVATMLPVIKALCTGLPNVSPYLLYFGLLIGATLGGNLTPIGASANVVAIGLLKKEGYEVRNRDFFKIGIPFTLVAVLVGYAFTWLIWS